MIPRPLRHAHLLSLLVLPLLMGCPKRSPLPDLMADPLGAASHPQDGLPLMGAMSLNIVAPRFGIAGTTPATLVVARPGGLYLQVRGPLGGVMMDGAAAADGFSIVLPGRNRVLRDEDPDAALLALTRGALGLDGVLALLEARLPKAGLDFQQADQTADLLLLTAIAPAGHQIHASVDRRTGLLTALSLQDEAGVLLLDLNWEGSLLLDGVPMPASMSLSIAPLEIRAKARYRSWSLAPTDRDLFHLTVPEGFEMQSLESAIQGISGEPEGEQGAELAPTPDAEAPQDLEAQDPGKQPAP